MARKSTKRPTPQKEFYSGDGVTQFTTHCPTCGDAIYSQATVDAFNEPPAWGFWGRVGERWQKCRGTQGGYTFVHFWTLLNGRKSDRIAWIRPTPETAAVAQELPL